MSKFKVYFLLKDRKPVYIGYTKNLPQRMRGHKDKEYDCVRWMDCRSRKSALHYEKRWLQKFKPMLNVNGVSEEKAHLVVMMNSKRAQRLRLAAVNQQKTISIVVENALEKDGI